MIDLNTILLVTSALLPALVLCIYIYRNDRVEKEPLSLLLKVFFLGAASCFPAAYIEEFIIGIIDFFFGTVNQWDDIFYLYNFIYYFVGVALVEEGVKLFVLKYTVDDNNNLNCLFDGMIYAVFASLGFAALENILYVLRYGFYNAILRAVLSVPGHMFFGVMMGYCYSHYIIYKKAFSIETKLKKSGYIGNEKERFKYSKFRTYTLLIPVLIHGMYDFCCTIDSLFFTVLFLAFIVFLYYYCFRKIKEASFMDDYNNIHAMRLVLRKYPNLQNQDIEVDLIV